MHDKIKSTCCLLISAVGWMIFVSGIIYAALTPADNEFSGLVKFGWLMQFSIVALSIHFINCLLSIVFLIQTKIHKKLFMPGLVSSAVFIVLGTLVYLFATFESTVPDSPPRELDVRWKVYTKDYHPPDREISLKHPFFSADFFTSSADPKVLYASVLCTSGEYANIYCLDLADGKPRLTCEGHRGSTQSLSFSFDGRRAVSGGKNGEIIWWDLEKGVEIGRRKGHTDYVRSVAYSPVGNQALSGGDSGEILLWDLNTMQIMKTFEGHTSGIRFHSLVWGRDGEIFLSGSWDGSIRLWDIETGEELVHLQAGYGRVMSIDLSPDGKFALSSYLNGPNQPVIYWDLETRQEVNRFGVPGNPWHADRQLHVESVAFAPDGKTALFGLAFGTVIWWDLNEWKPISMNRLFEKELVYVHFSEDNQDCCAIGCDESTLYDNAKIRCWRLRKPD